MHNLLFRVSLSKNGNIYLPYVLDTKKFTQDEIQKIENVIFKHCPRQVDSMFNCWQFTKFSSSEFWAKKQTWQQGMYSGTLDEVLNRIDNYYSR